MPGFTIPPEQITQAELELARLERVIEDASRRRDAVRAFLRAAGILRHDDNIGSEEAPSLTEEPEEPITDERIPDHDSSNLQGLVEEIANASSEPISKALMKTKLKIAGVAADRAHGSYFYVAVDRLRKKGRISVLEDGRIWKANPQP